MKAGLTFRNLRSQATAEGSAGRTLDPLSCLGV